MTLGRSCRQCRSPSAGQAGRGPSPCPPPSRWPAPEFNKAAQALPAPPQAPAAPAPATGENGARPANEHPTPPAGEGAEAGAMLQTAT